jgi:hypothetical protein
MPTEDMVADQLTKPLTGKQNLSEYYCGHYPKIVSHTIETTLLPRSIYICIFINIYRNDNHLMETIVQGIVGMGY